MVGDRSQTLTKDDRLHPLGPLQIGGSNQQLEAANYYYGLGPKAFYNIHDCLVGKPKKEWQPSRKKAKMG